MTTMTDNIISDVWSLSLGLTGIYVSVIAMLFATLASKVEEMRVVKKSQEFGQMNRATAIRNSVSTLRRFNKKAVYALDGSFLLLLLSTTAKYVAACWLVAICVTLSLLLVAYSIGLIYQIFVYYQTDNS